MKLTTSKLQQIIKEELRGVLGETSTPSKEWWTEDPKKILSYVYWLKDQIPPSDQRSAWEELVPQLMKKMPPPPDVEIPRWEDEGFDAESAIAGLGDISNEVRDELLNLDPKTQEEFDEMVSVILNPRPDDYERDY